MHLTALQKQTLLETARDAIRSILCGTLPQPLPSDPELHQPAGCFVSLHELRTHRLRGCVGRLDSRAPLAPTVHAMARSVLEDPRFLHFPVTFTDLPMLDIELSILSPLTPAAHPLDFDLEGDGIYVTHGDRSGCFLPQVARETGWTKEQLLDRLCTEKLGLPPQVWRHSASRLHRFTVILVGPEPFLKMPVRHV
jgi:AmmeMemoRadiSam system protein A